MIIWIRVGWGVGVMMGREFCCWAGWLVGAVFCFLLLANSV